MRLTKTERINQTLFKTAQNWLRPHRRPEHSTYARLELMAALKAWLEHREADLEPSKADAAAEQVQTFIGGAKGVKERLNRAYGPVSVKDTPSAFPTKRKTAKKSAKTAKAARKGRVVK